MKVKRYIYLITGLILAYILISKRSKIPGAIKVFSDGFSLIWGALVKPTQKGA